MRKSLIVFCLFLSACATPEQIEEQRQAQEQADVDTCASYGFRFKSDGFRNCLLQLDIAREQRYDNYYNNRIQYEYYPSYRHGGRAGYYLRH